MIIKCTLCPFEAKSLLVVQEEALGEVGRKLAQHISEKHQEATVRMAQSGARIGLLGMWLMIMNLYARIPEEETYILSEIDKREGELMSLLGFDREEPKENEDVTLEKAEAD